MVSLRTDDRAPANSGRDKDRDITSILDRVPPQNLDAEKGVLGSLVLDPEQCDEVAMVVRAEDFYAPSHQILFTHLMGMHNEGTRIDVTLLVERLRKHAVFESVGGVAYLADVCNSVPTAANAVHYSTIVRDKATLRSMIHASTEILRDSYDQSSDAREMLAKAEEKIFRILDDKGAADLSIMQDVLEEALVRIDSRLARGDGIGGMSSGFVDLDSQTGGLHESELLILAARPSMGKTALAANISEAVSVDQKRTTLFVSLEMSKLELAERMLCSRGRINGHKLRNGFISATDRRKLIDVSSEMSQAPLYIDDSPSRTITEIAATARRLKRREDLGLVVIDYLQLIEPDNARDPRQEQVAKIARRLKGMARELKVPVLCLAQLNRQTEVSKDNRPRLSHLHKSGAIEQDADVVMFVHRDEYYIHDEEEKARVAGQADIIIAKQRNGPIGDIKVAWLQDFTRFENLSRSENYDFNDL